MSAFTGRASNIIKRIKKLKNDWHQVFMLQGGGVGLHLLHQRSHEKMVMDDVFPISRGLLTIKVQKGPQSL